MSTPVRLASEDVILSSPMSLSGGTRRVFRLVNLRFAGIAQPAAQIAVRVAWWVGVAAWILAAAVVALLVWNVLAWTVFLVPMLIIRAFGRSKRRGRQAEAQHRELLDQLKK